MFKKCGMRPGFGMPEANNCCDRQPGCPIIEPVINKCIEREFCHEVQQE